VAAGPEAICLTLFRAGIDVIAGAKCPAKPHSASQINRRRPGRLTVRIPGEGEKDSGVNVKSIPG
jgi:hypothetical protein